MFIRKKSNQSGSVSVQVIDKSGGQYRVVRRSVLLVIPKRWRGWSSWGRLELPDKSNTANTRYSQKILTTELLLKSSSTSWAMHRLEHSARNSSSENSLTTSDSTRFPSLYSAMWSSLGWCILPANSRRWTIFVVIRARRFIPIKSIGFWIG